MEQAQTDCKGAEAVRNLPPNSSISIAYHPLFGPHNDIILLEVDEKLLPDVLHERVTLRGQPDEDAVFCTETETYAMKFVGTSNSVFLIPPSNEFAFCGNWPHCDEKNHDLEGVASIIKVASGYMELVEVAPRLDKLKLILSKNPYGSENVFEMDELEGADTNRNGLYKWDDLIVRIQASNAELRSALHGLSAVEIDGYWRIVDEKYMDMSLSMLLHNLVLNDWCFDSLDEDEVVAVLELDGFPRKLALHCLEVHGSKVAESIGGSCIWRLDQKRVCVCFARKILREGKRKMENFMEEWLRKIPEGVQPSFDMLEGEVLTEKIGVETWVYAFSISSLPSNPAERFSVLFRERPRWNWKDLQPFVRDLKIPGISLEGLLLKYTRRTQPTLDAEPIFSAR